MYSLILIKPLYKAIQDKDSIYAIIKGSAVNQDGASVGVSAPNGKAQENVIKKASGKMLESLQLFDVYEGKQIPEGKKSVAYSAIYRSADRSLTGDEVQKVFDKVVKNLENQIGAQLR